MDKNFLKEVQLKNGELLIIRQAEEDDAEALIKYLNQVGGESDNLLFGKDDLHMTIEQEVEFINRIRNDQNTLMLVGLINDSIVSVAQIGCKQRKRISHNSELAISVKKNYWSNGVGSAMMGELLHFAESNEIITNVGLGVKADNDKAIKLYEKFGFRKVGAHKDYFNINGVYHDLILMDLYLDK